MPYENEHACRLQNPELFKADSFRRGTRKHNGKTYGVIYGKKKGKQKMEEQAYRYSKKTWDADEARSHCKNHGGKFEAASSESSSLARNYQNVVEAFSSTAWAIMPEKMAMIIEFLDGKTGGEVINFDAQDVEAARAKRATRYKGIKGDIAIIPVYGIIAQKMNLLTLYSGGTSTELLTKEIIESVNDNSIGAIILDVNSPGGSVYGVKELADVIYQARGKKPIVAVVNSLMASAAYWIGSAADEIVVTPSGEIGSIGVIATHIDTSKEHESLGRKITIITAGKYKGEGNPYMPLDEEALASIQASVDSYYEDFTKDIARYRSTKQLAVKNGYGEGRVLRAVAAIAEGMADRQGTMLQVIEGMQESKSKPRRNRAMLQMNNM